MRAACAVRTVSAHGAPHLTPAQAAQSAGVSRWAILRAIKSLKLQAKRDNRNNWRIAPDDLAAWCAAQGAHSVRDGAVAQVAAQADSVEIAVLRERLAASDARAAALETERDGLRDRLAAATARADAAERSRDVAEADRDAWRAMAEKLAARRRWWPFR